NYAVSKGITLTHHLASSLPNIQANDFRLLQILDNLIGNALKFSPRGATVEVRTSGDVDHIHIEVVDSGPGLREADFLQLFVKHAKLSNQPTGNETSSGMGLALCKQLVKLDNGHIGARNNPHTGATFWIKLPVN
ncbi:MAG: ATP-binding protein, partial [Gammaproteobacteria bacterium]|nr:ATP-binding protein [Gammaproteobacteria bacterium]